VSYEIRLRAPTCPTCGHNRSYPRELPDPTYNLTPVFDLALTGERLPFEALRANGRIPGLHRLDGRAASDTLAELRAAVKRIDDPEWAQHFRARAPENGWGTVSGAAEVLRQLLEAAEREPELLWDIR
jgi:hypothetical protein